MAKLNPCAEETLAKYGADALDAIGEGGRSEFTRVFNDVIGKHNVQEAFQIKDKLYQQKRMAAAVKYSNAVRHAAALQKQIDKLPRWAHDYTEGATAAWGASQQGIEGAAESTGAKAETSSIFWRNEPIRMMREAGIDPLLDMRRSHNDANYELHVGENILALRDGKPMPHTSDSMESQVAEIRKSVGDALVNAEIAAGGHTGILDTWFMPQVWDQYKMERFLDAKAGTFLSHIDPRGSKFTPEQHRAGLIAEARSRIDDAKTFGDSEFYHYKDIDPKRYEKSVNEFLGSWWDSKVSGVHLSNTDNPIGLRGASTIQSKERVLHWKSAADSLEMNKVIGSSSPAEAYYHMLGRRGKRIAIMEDWGPNYRLAYDQYKTHIERAIRSAPNAVEQGRKWNSKTEGEHFVDSIVANVDGSINIPGTSMLARLVHGGKSLAVMTKLWGLSLMQLGDTVTKDAEMQRAGMDVVTSVSKMVDHTTKMMNKEARTKVALSSTVGLESMMGDLSRMGSTQPGVVGSLTRATQYFVKYQGTLAINDINRAAHSMTFGSWLDEHREFSWKELNEKNPDLAREGLRYGINEKNWDIVRKYAGQETVSGVRMMTPDGIKEAPSDAFMPLVKDQIQEVTDAEEKSLNKLGIRAKNASVRAAQALSAAGKHGTGYDPEIIQAVGDHNAAVAQLKSKSAKRITDAKDAAMSKASNLLQEEGVVSTVAPERIKNYLDTQARLAKIEKKYGPEAISSTEEAHSLIAKAGEDKAAIASAEHNLTQDLGDLKPNERAAVRTAVLEVEKARESVGSELTGNSAEVFKEVDKTLKKVRKDERKALKKALETKTEEIHNRIDELTPKDHPLGQTPADEILAKATAALEDFKRKVAGNAETAGMSQIQLDKLSERALGVITRAQKDRVRILSGVQRDLADKLRTYISDKAYTGVLMADARVRANLNRGLPQGSWERSFLDAVTMFHSFPMAAWSKGVTRSLYGLGDYKGVYHWWNAKEHVRRLSAGNGEFSSVARMAINNTIMGMFLLELRLVARGRQPMLPQDPKEAMDFLMRANMISGGWGVIGDQVGMVFLNEQGRMGSNPMFGPGGDVVKQMYDAAQNIRAGKPISKETAELIIKNMPNTFYTKGLWETYGASWLRETAKPGSQAEFEQGQLNHSKQRFLLPTYRRN